MLELIVRALCILRDRENVGELVLEVDLNRELCLCFRQANRLMYEEGRGFDHLPVCEACNQPTADDIERAEREAKKPDFQWELIDHYEVDPRLASRHFAIECKRLGSPPSPTWILNSNYVGNGVVRFVYARFGYGKLTPSGLMIGYLQDLDHDAVLSEVNVAIVKEGLPSIAREGDAWVVGSVTYLAHSFDREYEVSPFRLQHLWLDLRDRYIQGSTVAGTDE